MKVSQNNNELYLMQYTLVYSILIKMSVDIQQFNFTTHNLKNIALDSEPSHPGGS